MPEITDLMRRYCEGDASAFRGLYERVAPQLFGYLVRLTRQRARAADLLQHTFLKVHRARGAYIEGADPIPWIYAIAHRTFIDDQRKVGREVSYDGDLDELPQERAGLDGGVAARCEDTCDPALVQATLEAIADLPTQQRQALVLTKLEGRSIAEAAEIAGTTSGAMRVRIHRGYEALRSTLRQGARLAARIEGAP